jgi:hypothetical protein
MQKLLHYSGLLLVLFLLTGLFSCERLSELYRLKEASGTKVEKEHDENGNQNSQDTCGEPVIIRLVSRDNLEYSPGNIVVSNDDEYLAVKLEATEQGWNIDMIYLQVGPLDLVPLDEAGSYPAFWDFDFQYADEPVASYSFRIPLADLDDCVNILVQARFTDGSNNMVTWSEGINPDWTEGPFYTYYCIEHCKEACDACKKGKSPTRTKGGWGDKAAGNDD